MMADVVYMAVNHEVKEINQLEDIIFPEEPGMFDY